jgi:hypothetical protein
MPRGAKQSTGGHDFALAAMPTDMQLHLHSHLALELEVAAQLGQLRPIEWLGVCSSEGFQDAQLKALCTQSTAPVWWLTWLPQGGHMTTVGCNASACGAVCDFHNGLSGGLRPLPASSCLLLRHGMVAAAALTCWIFIQRISIALGPLCAHPRQADPAGS